MAKFGIAVRPTRTPVGWNVEGRCWTDIRVGDVFTSVASYTTTWDEQGEPHTIYAPEHPTWLVIRCIHGYGRQHQWWSAGMTALLELEGEGDLQELEFAVLATTPNVESNYHAAG
jgi:hypothetical protein